jgi:hypothetical protein
MIISDLNYLETTKAADISGASAFADAWSTASARGKFFAATYTDTYTTAYSGFFRKSASSGSYSSSTAY